MSVDTLMVLKVAVFAFSTEVELNWAKNVLVAKFAVLIVLVLINTELIELVSIFVVLIKL